MYPEMQASGILEQDSLGLECRPHSACLSLVLHRDRPSWLSVLGPALLPMGP